MDVTSWFSRGCSLFGVWMIAVWALPDSADAGGMDSNHYWAVNIGDSWFSVAEYKSYPRKTGGVFTRIQISAQLNGRKRTFGRDFQCSIEEFWMIAGLILACILAGFAFIGCRYGSSSGKNS